MKIYLGIPKPKHGIITVVTGTLGGWVDQIDTLSPIIMVQWKMSGYLKGNDPIGDTPIFH